MARKRKSRNTKKNVKRTTRKKTTGKTRPRKVNKNDSRRYGNRTKATRRKTSKRAKPIRSNVVAISVRPSRVYSRKKAKSTARKVSVSQFRITEGKKTKSSHRFNIGFKGGRSLRERVVSLETERFKESFHKQLKRKRKLPIAFILTMTDKNGQYISETSGLDEAVSAANIAKALKRSAKRKDINTDSGEKRGYKEFNPNHIVKVEVQFIYRQLEIEE